MSKIKIDGKEYTPEEVAALQKAGVLTLRGAKNDASSTTPTGTNPYGPNPGDNTQFGPLSGAGVRPDMYSAVPQEETIASVIPFLPSDIYNELIEVMTGVTDSTGSNETNSGTVGARAGNLKVAKQVYTFGIIHMATKIYDESQLGMKKNRASVDRNLYNLATFNNPLLPQVPGIDGNNITARTLRQELYALGSNLNRSVSPVHYVGTSGTENDDYAGIARQWNGLDNLIKTGYTDSETGLAAAALDSDVRSFNAVITGSDSNGQDFVSALTSLIYGLRELDRKTFNGGVQRALIMRFDLFREAAKQFAYAYTVYVGSGTTSAPLNRDGQAAQEMFTDMLENKYLLIDGMRVPVLCDDNIPRETVANNQYKSDIYAPALSVNGRPLLYGEYFNMDNEDAREFRNAFGLGDATTQVLNNGLYLVFRRQTGGILEYDFFARPRLILDAPFLSGRLDDIIYNSYFRQTDATPGDSYYRDGGVTYRS